MMLAKDKKYSFRFVRLRESESVAKKICAQNPPPALQKRKGAGIILLAGPDFTERHVRTWWNKEPGGTGVEIVTPERAEGPKGIQ